MKVTLVHQQLSRASVLNIYGVVRGICDDDIAVSVVVGRPPRGQRGSHECERQIRFRADHAWTEREINARGTVIYD
jgi:hypothetical protein